MIRNFTETGQEIDKGAVSLAGVITSGLVGVSNSALAWADAFCVTESCKNARKQIAASEKIAESQREQAKYGFLAEAVGAKAASRQTYVYGAIGIGVIALGAYYLATRGR